jgi:hypothetical protein
MRAAKCTQCSVDRPQPPAPHDADQRRLIHVDRRDAATSDGNATMPAEIFIHNTGKYRGQRRCGRIGLALQRPDQAADRLCGRLPPPAPGPIPLHPC